MRPELIIGLLAGAVACRVYDWALVVVFRLQDKAGGSR